MKNDYIFHTILERSVLKIDLIVPNRPSSILSEKPSWIINPERECGNVVWYLEKPSQTSSLIRHAISYYKSGSCGMLAVRFLVYSNNHLRRRGRTDGSCGEREKRKRREDGRQRRSISSRFRDQVSLNDPSLLLIHGHGRARLLSYGFGFFKTGAEEKFLFNVLLKIIN